VDERSRGQLHLSASGGIVDGGDNASLAFYAKEPANLLG
jgi:hypothetical protein